MVRFTPSLLALASFAAAVIAGPPRAPVSPVDFKPPAPTAPAEIRDADAMVELELTYPAGIVLDLYVADAVQWDTSGFVPDPEDPTVTAANAWKRWLQRILDGTYDPSRRVYCGLTLPYFSTSLADAEAAAAQVGYEPDTSDPEELCNDLLAELGYSPVLKTGAKLHGELPRPAWRHRHGQFLDPVGSGP